MTAFLTIAPMPVDFALTPGAAIKDPDAYAAFWRTVATRHDGLPLQFTHATDVVRQPRYESLRSDAMDRELHVLHGDLTTSELHLDLTRDLAELWGCVKQVRFWLYDHHLLLVELSGQAEEWLREEELTRRLDKLQRGLIDLTERAARTIATDVIQPTLALAREKDQAAQFVEAAASTPPEPVPWWVARALVVDPSSKQDQAEAKHWLANSAEPDIVSEFLAGERTHVARWLNYAYRGVRHGNVTRLAPGLAEHWRAMRYSQYFYTALDQVDGRLNEVLTETTTGLKRWEIDELSQRLRALSHRAESVIMNLQGLRKYVTRDVLAEMNEVLAAWDYQQLIEEPVQYKTGVCERRINDLNADAQARAGTVTDVILLGIGVTSVLATALALTDFGRQMAADPDQAGFGSFSSGITEWFAAQPADAILIGSILISALLVLLFLAVRRSQPS